MKEPKDIAVADAIPLAASKDAMDRPMSAALVRQQMGLVQDILDSVLTEGVHYGTVPGVQARFLFKAGAEKLSLAFHLRGEYELVDNTKLPGDDRTQGFVDFTVRCRLFHQGTGALVGEALGNCNSRERKYRERSVPANRATPLEKKTGRMEERSGKNGSWAVVVLPVDPFEILHTLLAMAQKRAFTAAVRAALAATDVLHVDEDMAAELRSEADGFGQARQDAQADDTLREASAAAAKKKDRASLLQQASKLSQRWVRELDKTGDDFASLVELVSGGETDDPTKLKQADVQKLLDAMNADLAGVA